MAHNGKWGPKWLLNELASAVWTLIDANVGLNCTYSIPLGLNRTMCVWGGDMSPYSVSGAKPQPLNIFLDIIGVYVSAGCRPPGPPYLP